jgi:hypothetical protein
MAHAVPERKPDGKGALASGSGQTVEVQQLRPQGFRAFRCAFAPLRGASLNSGIPSDTDA